MIGEGHTEKVMSLVKRVLKLSYGILCIMIALVCIFPEAIARIYTDIPDLIRDSVPAIIVMTSAYLLNVGGQVFFQAVSGTGSTKTAFKLEMVALAFYLIYCTVIIGMMKMNVAVCWTAEHVYGGILLLCSWLYLRSGRWKNRQI